MFIFWGYFNVFVSDMAQNFENFWKVKILDILILILILKTAVSKYWFWYWYWKMHFQNIDFDIDIESFGSFDIDIGIDIEKMRKILKIWVVRKRLVPPGPWVFCLIFHSFPHWVLRMFLEVLVLPHHSGYIL